MEGSSPKHQSVNGGGGNRSSYNTLTNSPRKQQDRLHYTTDPSHLQYTTDPSRLQYTMNLVVNSRDSLLPNHHNLDNRRQSSYKSSLDPPSSCQSSRGKLSHSNESCCVDSRSKVIQNQNTYLSTCEPSDGQPYRPGYVCRVEDVKVTLQNGLATESGKNPGGISGDILHTNTDRVLVQTKLKDECTGQVYDTPIGGDIGRGGRSVSLINLGSANLLCHPTPLGNSRPRYERDCDVSREECRSQLLRNPRYGKVSQTLLTKPCLSGGSFSSSLLNFGSPCSYLEGGRVDAIAVSTGPNSMHSTSDCASKKKC